MMRRGNTGKEIVDSGEFIKIGPKQYEHGESGIQIIYNHNRFLWQVQDDFAFSVLHAAVSRVRTLAAEKVAA